MSGKTVKLNKRLANKEVTKAVEKIRTSYLQAILSLPLKTRLRVALKILKGAK